MNRRFVNLLVNRLCSPRPAFKLHRIDPASLFYTAGSPRPAAETSPPAPGRLPSAAMSFDWPCQRHRAGWMDFMAFKNSSIVAVDHEGRTILYDCASRAIRAMPQTSKPSSKTISFTVGEGLYVMAREPGTPPQPHHFQALVYDRPHGFLQSEDWHWRPLHQPRFDFLDGEQDPCNYTPEDMADPYAISSYALLGDSQIWISTVAGGTYSYDTESGMWSGAPVAAVPPFSGRVEYVPEHRLWFGFSAEDEQQLCAANLSSNRPLPHKVVWEDPPPPPDEACSLTASHLLPMGSGKLCVARVFQRTDMGELLPSGYTRAQRFVVLSGVEVFMPDSVDSLQVIKHKSKCYSLGNHEVQLL